MKLTNRQIYFTNQKLVNVFSEKEQESLYLPAKILFYIEKNRQIFYSLAQEIEKIRLNIVNKYKNQEDNIIPQDKIEIANQELDDLLDIKQDVNIYTISLDDLQNIEFTPLQMEVLLFMIEDPEVELG